MQSKVTDHSGRHCTPLSNHSRALHTNNTPSLQLEFPDCTNVCSVMSHSLPKSSVRQNSMLQRTKKCWLHRAQLAGRCAVQHFLVLCNLDFLAAHYSYVQPNLIMAHFDLPTLSDTLATGLAQTSIINPEVGLSNLPPDLYCTPAA